MMLDIARHYAAVPQAQRPRTLVFLTTSDHHHGSTGIRWVRDNYDWSKVALIVNSEHPSQTLLYNLDAGLMTANEVSARRWYVGGSDALRMLVRNSLREFGVATYHKSEVSPGGELSQIHMKAPSFHIIDHVIYHTTLDTADLVPAWGLEDATRLPQDHRRRQQDDEAADRSGVGRPSRFDATGALRPVARSRATSVLFPTLESHCRHRPARPGDPVTTGCNLGTA
jgi:hypothetical protein